MRMVRPCTPRASARSFSASTTKCRWLPCTENWLMRNPNRSRPWRNRRGTPGSAGPLGAFEDGAFDEVALAGHGPHRIHRDRAGRGVAVGALGGDAVVRRVDRQQVAVDEGQQIFQ